MALSCFLAGVFLTQAVHDLWAHRAGWAIYNGFFGGLNLMVVLLYFIYTR